MTVMDLSINNNCQVVKEAINLRVLLMALPTLATLDPVHTGPDPCGLDI